MQPVFESKSDEDRRVYSVAEIVASVNAQLEAGYSEVWIKGEVGELSFPKSGHVYFTLKDEAETCVLSAVMFKPNYMRRQFDLASGRVVVVRGMLTIYPPRGSFQVVVRSFSDAGAGLLALQFEALKRKLMEEGLTDEARKRPLPLLPRTIGIVTSLEAAALQDMLRILRGRAAARIVVSPAPVQGEEAPARLIGALEKLSGVEGLEVVIIGRGGGSAEDLAPFNDEGLARAVAAFPVPVISAVGHEVDWTICDLVADVRAPTPTAAAQTVIPAREDLESELHRLEVRLSRSVEACVSRARNLVFALRGRMIPPQKMIMVRRQRMDELHAAMLSGMRARVSATRLRLEKLSLSLSHLHPGAALRRRRELLERRTMELSSRP
jgi:exodeoxyribonuclease VII large subunit